jgi:hypothetical protein
MRGKRIHGLLVCRKWSKLWTVDYNAAKNTAQAARTDLNDERRTSCLCEKRRSSPLNDMD